MVLFTSQYHIRAKPNKHIPNQALFSLPYNLPHQSSNPVGIRYRSPAYFHLRHHDLLSIYIYFSHSIPLFWSISPHSPFPSLPPLQPHPHTSHPTPFIHPRNKTPSDPKPRNLYPPHSKSPISQILHDLVAVARLCALGGGLVGAVLRV